MNITIEDILNKYETKIDTKKMSEKLKNKILYSDEQKYELLPRDTITIEDIQKPVYTQENNYDKYTYKFKDYTMTVTYKPSNYRTVLIEITKPTPDNIPEPTYVWAWNSKGEIAYLT